MTAGVGTPPPGVEALPPDAVREALRLLGDAMPAGGRAAASRRLAERLRGHGAVRTVLEHAPDGARRVFLRLAHEGPAAVEDLLGRGWWGHGTLPPPLDWLQRRALVVVGVDGLVHATRDAREGFVVDASATSADPAAAAELVRVEAVGCVLVAPTPAALDRALTVAGAALRAVAPTVAVSTRSAAAVTAALRGARVALADDAVVPAARAAPALPTAAEDAVGPRAVRALLGRALDEGRQVRLQYFASSRGGAATDRVVDPWSFRDDLLRGYCHLRQGERTFAVDRVGHARLLPTPLEHLAR